MINNNPVHLPVKAVRDGLGTQVQPIVINVRSFDIVAQVDLYCILLIDLGIDDLLNYGIGSLSLIILNGDGYFIVC